MQTKSIRLVSYRRLARAVSAPFALLLAVLAAIAAPAPAVADDGTAKQLIEAYGCLQCHSVDGTIHHAKQLFYLPIFNKHWWSELFFEIRWYLFLESEPKKYVGHNPLAQLAMFCFMTLGLSFMIVTGMALYAEGLGTDSWLYGLLGWIFPVFGGNSQVIHSIHHLGMWFIVIFMIIHIYVAIREDIMSRQSIVSTMISGHRTFKDDRPD